MELAFYVILGIYLLGVTILCPIVKGLTHEGEWVGSLKVAALWPFFVWTNIKRMLFYRD